LSVKKLANKNNKFPALATAYRIETLSTISLKNKHSYFVLEGVAEISQIFLQDTHVLPE
jgi:hypothetical protein